MLSCELLLCGYGLFGHLPFYHIFRSSSLFYFFKNLESGVLQNEPLPLELPHEYAEIFTKISEIRYEMQNKEQTLRTETERKNDLITYLAHDLKTPLTSVIGYLTLLQDEPDISDILRSKYTGIAVKKAERLEELINELFEITRFNLSGAENILLAFTNKGITIPKEKLERIFEQFFRLDSSRSSSTGGSGLGLAIAKQLIEAHSGTIQAISQNEVIQFRIALPVNCHKIV